MERQRDEAREYADRLDVAGIHSCHSECQQSNCVLRRELTAVTEQRDRYKLACDQYSEDEILCKLQTVTEQRDRLAEALRRYAWPCSDAELAHHCASASLSFSVEAQREMKRRNALQSLTPKNHE